MKLARILPAFASIPTLALAVSPQEALAPGTAPEFARYLFKERASLRLDPTRVAVHASDRLVPSSLPPSLDRRGIDPTALPGWSLVRLSQPADASTIGAVVDELASSDAWSFVSPVFLDEFDGPLFPTPDVLVRFDASVSAAYAERMLASASPGAALEPEWAGMRGAWRLRTRETTGVRVLAIAEELALREEALFAEPDFVFQGERASSREDGPGGVLGTGVDTTGDPRIEILVLDDGIERTQVSGILAAFAGVASRYRAIPVRAFIANVASDRSWTSRFSWTADALAWGVARGIRITDNDNVYHATSSAIESAYQETRDAYGALHFAAAGNAADGRIAYPARLPAVEAIGGIPFDGAGETLSDERASRRPRAAVQR
jgi:hypothetical protein